MIRVVFLMTSCKSSGPVQQMLNLIKYLERTQFEPVLITLYPEGATQSRLALYTPYVEHIYVPTSKLDILSNRMNRLSSVLNQIRPAVIHSLGVFPDYAISRMQKWPHIITLRNYVYDDYTAKFGRIRGMILAKLHLYAMQRTQKTVTCSKSLSDIYRQKLQLAYSFVCNGVDLERYRMPSQSKQEIRERLGLLQDAFVFVYTGQLIARKNVDLLVEAFAENFGNRKDVMLLMLGGGELYDSLTEKYKTVDNVDFRGKVDCVAEYLGGCDAYVSASKSEGLPNGVLEAMAMGLPVVLSDIQQHKEIYDMDHEAGVLFPVNDIRECMRQMEQLLHKDVKAAGEKARQVVYTHFDAKQMSQTYQNLYRQIAES